MKKTLFASLLFVSIFLPFGSVMALPPQDGGANRGDDGGVNSQNVSVNFNIPNPFRGGGNLFKLVEIIIDTIILPIGAVLCVLAFIFSGFKYVMARGDVKGIEEANRSLLYSAIGTAVLLGSWTIAKVLENTINQLK